jgi:hypothetical protein
MEEYEKEFTKKVFFIGFLKSFGLEIPEDSLEKLAKETDLPDTSSKDKILGKLTIEEAAVCLALDKANKISTKYRNKLDADILRCQADLVEEDRQIKSMDEALDLISKGLKLNQEDQEEIAKSFKTRKFLKSLLAVMVCERLNCYRKVVHPTRQGDIVEDHNSINLIISHLD